MVYYPLTTLIEGGIREFCLISTPRICAVLAVAPGRQPVGLEHRTRTSPARGIAQAFRIADTFIGQDAVTLILGDNVFTAATVFSARLRISKPAQ